MKFKKIKIPKYWKYSESWCERNIENKYDLNKICKSQEAEFNIQYEIYSGGESLHIHCKNLNIMIDQLDDLIKVRTKNNTLNTMKWELRGNTSGYEFDTAVDKNIERIYQKYNVDLAPEFIQEIFFLMINMAKDGIAKYIEVCNYVESIREEQQRQELLAIEAERTPELTVEEKIELKWGKVESGFVYILDNEIMPNLYKVGFTARNPDRRAEEISSKSGLPKPFLVKKYWRTNDPYIVEQRIHEKLSDFAEGKEFFKGDLNEICKIIDHCVESNNKI